MNPRHPVTLFGLFKISVVLVWLALFVALLVRDSYVRTIAREETAALTRDRQSEYLGVYFNDRKIGFVEQHFNPAPGDLIQIRQQALMQLTIAGQTHPLNLQLDATIDPYSRLHDFHFTFSSPFYRMEAQGTVTGSTIVFTLDNGNSVVKDRLDLPEPPVLPTSRRSYLLNQTMAVGEKMRIPWFDPLSLTATASLVEYRGREKTLIHERVYNLHRFSESYAGVRVNIWLDDDGVVVKEESPTGFVFLREPEFKAKSTVQQADDLLASVAIPSDPLPPDIAQRNQQRYRLQLPEQGEFDISTGRQSLTGHILTITREQLPDQTSAGGCSDDAQQLRASPYIQATAPEIIAHAQKITAGHEQAIDRVKALSKWVYHTIEKRPVIGIPDALSTFRSATGDCNEHASLFAALARSIGIPSKIAVGVVWNKTAFYYHAWNEVCVSGTWVSLDTTTNQLPADLTHVKFVEGELQEQIRIGALINQLQITPLPD